jgi:hypothetical protein
MPGYSHYAPEAQCSIEAGEVHFKSAKLYNHKRISSISVQFKGRPASVN